MNIILASESPRRQELLHFLTDEFKIIPSDFPERDVFFHGDAPAYCEELALGKAMAVARRYPEDLVIGSDTVVFAGGQLMNKPDDRQDAFRMIETLQGEEHEVVTAYALIGLQAGIRRTGYEATKVRFSAMTAEEIEEYLDAGDYEGKAGAYAIQGAAARFVTRIEGDYYTVVGLPLARLYREFRNMDLL